MLIFVMPTSYPNPDNPVANLFIAEQVNALSEISGNRIVVLNVQKQPSKKLFSILDYRIQETDNNNINLVSIKHKTFAEDRLVITNQIGFTKAMRKLFKFACKRFGTPDVIYAHFYSAGWSAIKISKKYKIPVVVMEHAGVLMNAKLNNRKKGLLKYVVENAYAYLATTDNLKKHVVNHTHTKKSIEVVPNLVNEAFAFSLHKREEFNFFCLSRLEADKCVDLLIDAFCKAFNANDNIFLRIGGEGSEFEKLNRLISRFGRKHQIILLGKLNRLESVEEMQNCDAFVLPSRHETFGLVWREALCSGRPVITTDHGGFGPSDWKPKFGYMIPIDDEDQLVYALKNMYNNYENFDLRAISDENRQKYSTYSFLSHIMTIFIKAKASKE